ncbi:MAG TPA: ABC transporter ATP-binding protein [Candidatus Limnocylindrales bacterium]|nr:ABC transporter ATP-binding protein [Candidatus Limnocylindrales bacterium]
MSKTFSPGPVTALQKVNLYVREGEFVSLVGPSGCGKSTLFNIIAGLLQPDEEGEIYLDGERREDRRGFSAYMPQKDLLLPWRTILDNVILGLEIQGIKKSMARKEALALFPNFGLAGFEKNYPDSLSGGMRQRAALMRTILFKKDIMLLDEPFGALDAMTRSIMQQFLLKVWEEFRKTILFVTHDIEEAIFLSDRIYVMTARPGTIKAELSVPLPRPRDPHLVTSAPFVGIKRILMDLIQEESLKAFEEMSVVRCPSSVGLPDSVSNPPQQPLTDSPQRTTRQSTTDKRL